MNYANFLIELHDVLIREDKIAAETDFMQRLLNVAQSLKHREDLVIELNDDSVREHLELVYALTTAALGRKPETDAEFLAWLHDHLEDDYEFHETSIILRQLREIIAERAKSEDAQPSSASA